MDFKKMTSSYQKSAGALYLDFSFGKYSTLQGTEFPSSKQRYILFIAKYQ